MSKEKQIEEMIDDLMACHTEFYENAELYTDYQDMAENMFAKGYRKQSEGEWIAKPQEWYIGATDWMCSNCKTEFSPIDMMGDDFFRMMKFCPECGAKMKGGAE